VRGEEVPASPSPSVVLPNVPRLEYEGGVFGFEQSGENLSLVYQAPGVRRVVRVVTAPLNEFGRIIGIYYGTRWTVLVSHNYLLITLGAADVVAGRDKFQGNELLNAECVVLPERLIGSAFAEDTIFLFHPSGSVRIIQIDVDAGGMYRLDRVEGVGPQSVAIRSDGVYFLVQPGEIPVVAFARTGTGPWSIVSFPVSHPFPTVRSGIEPAADGFSALFIAGSRRMELRVRLGEEGNLDSISVTLRRERR
jgi:hypothetical protein